MTFRGGMGHEVREEHRLEFRKLAIIENQQKLSPVRSEALDGMGNAGREVPEIPFKPIALSLDWLRPEPCCSGQEW